MTPDSVPVAPLSIWKPVHLGTDELGRRVEVTLAERNMLIGGEPGGGKSVALQLIVAHGALSPDCRLILVDGKRVELGCGATAPTGSSAPPSTTRSTPCTGSKSRSTSAPPGCCTTRCARSPPTSAGPSTRRPPT